MKCSILGIETNSMRNNVPLSREAINLAKKIIEKYPKTSMSSALAHLWEERFAKVKFKEEKKDAAAEV